MTRAGALSCSRSSSRSGRLTNAGGGTGDQHRPAGHRAAASLFHVHAPSVIWRLAGPGLGNRGAPSGRRSDRRSNGSWCGGRAVRFRVRLVLSLIQAEGRVLVSHQGDIGENAEDPAVDADNEIEQSPWVLPGDQQEEAADEDQQPEERDRRGSPENRAPLVPRGPPVEEVAGE